MDVDLVKELVAIMNSNGLAELEYQTGGVTVRLRKAAGPAPAPAESACAQAPAPAKASAPEAATGTPTRPAGESEIPSPMVGTFYRASSPDSQPFVSVGDSVEPDTVIGIIEAMKIMNEIPAGVRGVIREFLVVDHEAVEYGQPLAVIEPAA